MQWIVAVLGFLAATVVAKPLANPVTTHAARITNIYRDVDGEPVTAVTFTIPDNVAMPTKAPRPAGAAGDGQPRTSNVTDDIWAHCSGRNMPNDNWESENAAIEYFKSECQPGNAKYIAPRTGVIWRKKEAQIYYCNYQFKDSGPGGPRYCDVSDWDNAGQPIDWDCGQGGGGWYFYETFFPGWHYSVGRDPRYDENGNEIEECGDFSSPGDPPGRL